MRWTPVKVRSAVSDVTFGNATVMLRVALAERARRPDRPKRPLM